MILGLPIMIMEFSVGRAAQASPIKMYPKLEKKGQKWHIHGYVSFFGSVALMAFYTVVTGWIVYYFVRFLTGNIQDLGFSSMITNPGVNVTYLAVTVVLAFGILCFGLQGRPGAGHQIYDDAASGADAGAGVAQLHPVRCGGGAAVLSGAGPVQNQRQRGGGGHEPGLLHPIRGHGCHGYFRQLHRKKSAP